MRAKPHALFVQRRRVIDGQACHSPFSALSPNSAASAAIAFSISRVSPTGSATSTKTTGTPRVVSSNGPTPAACEDDVGCERDQFRTVLAGGRGIPGSPSVVDAQVGAASPAQRLERLQECCDARLSAAKVLSTPMRRTHCGVNRLNAILRGAETSRQTFITTDVPDGTASRMRSAAR